MAKLVATLLLISLLLLASLLMLLASLLMLLESLLMLLASLLMLLRSCEVLVASLVAVESAIANFIAAVDVSKLLLWTLLLLASCRYIFRVYIKSQCCQSKSIGNLEAISSMSRSNF